MTNNLDGCIIQVITEDDRFMGLVENTGDPNWIKLLPFKDEEVEKTFGESVLLPTYKRESTITTIIVIKDGDEKESNKEDS
tara:strand:- start:492 stop:734 length:243 start_codon:yes stop_codon:yes gene_type:complete